MVSRREIGSQMQRSLGKGGLLSIVSYSCPSLMIIAPGTQFHVYLPWGQHLFSIVSKQCLNSVLNVIALVGTFNQEKALVGAFSVIVKTDCGTDGSFYSTKYIMHSKCKDQLRIEASQGCCHCYCLPPGHCRTKVTGKFLVKLKLLYCNKLF